MCKQYSANDGQWATLCTARTYSTLNAESDWLVRYHFGMYVPEGISLGCVIRAVYRHLVGIRLLLIVSGQLTAG